VINVIKKPRIIPVSANAILIKVIVILFSILSILLIEILPSNTDDKKENISVNIKLIKNIISEEKPKKSVNVGKSR